jgi:hypothetical protein
MKSALSVSGDSDLTSSLIIAYYVFGRNENLTANGYHIRENIFIILGKIANMFGKGRIRAGEYVFVVQKDRNYVRLIIGRIQNVNGSKIQINGFYIRPVGLIERVESGRGGGRPSEVLNNPDPNNCIFMLIDRVETGMFNQEVNQSIDKTIWINEKRYFVLDGWIRENLPDMFADVLRANSDDERIQAREILLEKMNSLYEKDLKDHLYAVARSTKIL